MQILKGKEILVSARGVQSEFRGIPPRGIRYICPLCRQPLFPAAMSLGGKQSPHFRHERNNERARKCELYASSFGYFSTYQRIPMPMFIKKSRAREESYDIEGGFRRLSESVLAELEHEGASLEMGQKRYKITAQRFKEGLTKLPFERASLKWGSSVRLINSSLDLDQTWGRPEDAKRAMIFTRDDCSNRGKRVKMGDPLVFGSDYYLVAPKCETSAIMEAFPESRRVGSAGSCMPFPSLEVFEITLVKESSAWTKAQVFLEDCDFKVAEVGETPQLIWPPSLASEGDLLPLFNDSPCLFKASAQSAADGKLFVHTTTDSDERVRTVTLKKSGTKGFAYAILKNAASLSFVTTRNWVFSAAVLLHPSDSFISEWLAPAHREYDVLIDDAGLTELTFNTPGTVVLLKENHASKVFDAKEEERSFSLSSADADAFRVLFPLGESLDKRLAFEHVFALRNERVSPERHCETKVLQLLPVDTQRAFARQRNERLNTGIGSSKSTALARRCWIEER